MGISLCSPGFIFKQSPNNRRVSSSKCTFLFKEFDSSEQSNSTVFLHLTRQEGWNSVVFDSKYKVNDEFYKTGFTVPGFADDSAKFEWENGDGSQLHSSVYHLLRPLVTRQENNERIDGSSALFTRTLYQLLRATKLISW